MSSMPASLPSTSQSSTNRSLKTGSPPSLRFMEAVSVPLSTTSTNSSPMSPYIWQARGAASIPPNVLIEYVSLARCDPTPLRSAYSLTAETMYVSLGPSRLIMRGAPNSE